jgi:hypothetical protein
LAADRGKYNKFQLTQKAFKQAAVPIDLGRLSASLVSQSAEESGPPSPTDLRTRLDKVLSQMQTPVLYDSAWIGPFEQLVGAVFSLIESEKRGFSRRKYSEVYHPAVQCKIASLLGELEAGLKSTQQDALDNWLSRYYFNAGIQRVNFAAERLIATFAALPCTCGSRPPEIAIRNNRPPKFKELLDGAQLRLAHVETEYSSSVSKLKVLLGQLSTPYDRNDPFDPAKGLAMIRQDVNRRKHSVYKRSETLDALPRPASDTVTWSNAGCKARMETAVACLELVAGGYSELHAWYPMAKF